MSHGFFKMTLGTLEDFYMYGAAVCFYIFIDGATSIQTIVMGCLACFGFFPGYPALSMGGRLMPIKTLVINITIGTTFLLLMRALLDEHKTNEMCVLFLCSYVACKAFRFAAVRVLVSCIGRQQ